MGAVIIAQAVIDFAPKRIDAPALAMNVIVDEFRSRGFSADEIALGMARSLGYSLADYEPTPELASWMLRILALEAKGMLGTTIMARAELRKLGL